MEILVITSCRPSKNFKKFNKYNILINNALKYKNIKLVIFNKKKELPIEIINNKSIEIIENFNNKKPSIKKLFSYSNNLRIITNSDIEFNFIYLIKILKQINEFDICSGQRMDYQSIKSRYKIQSKETLDYFILKNKLPENFIKSLVNVSLGDIKVDNFIIDHAFKHKLKILDLTYVNKVYHKNHEQFKISGYFNLILKPNDQTEFQNSRRTYKFYKHGSLWFSHKVLLLNNKILIIRLPYIINFFLYKLSRVKIKLINRIEVILSKFLIKKGKIPTSFGYLFIHYPKYKK